MDASRSWESAVRYECDPQVQSSRWVEGISESQVNANSGNANYFEPATCACDTSGWDASCQNDQSAAWLENEWGTQPKQPSNQTTSNEDYPRNRPSILIVLINRAAKSQPGDKQATKDHQPGAHSNYRKDQHARHKLHPGREKSDCHKAGGMQAGARNASDATKDSDECNVGCLERTLLGPIPNEECLSYLKSLTCAKRPIKKKKKFRPKTVFDRFADPPFVIEPKTFIVDGCHGNCRHSCCHSCRCCAPCWS